MSRLYKLKNDSSHNLYLNNKKIKVFSLNYDFLPSSVFRDKVLWIETDYIPIDLKIGNSVKLVSDSIELTLPQNTFQVEDISGKRIILSSKLIPVSFYLAKGNPRYYGSGIYNLGLDYPQYVSTHYYGLNKTLKADRNLWHPLDHTGHFGYSTRDFTSQPGDYRGWQYGNGKPIAYLIY